MDMLILLLGFVGILTILFTKHTIFGGILTVAMFIGYFFLYGSGQWIYLIILFLGLIMLALELIIPSFGAIGIVGMTMMGLGLYMSSEQPVYTLINFGVASLLSLTTSIILLKSGHQLYLTKGLVLKKQLTYDRAELYQQYVDHVGTTVTSLRPVGRVKFENDDIVEVVTSGEMIDEGERVVAYKIEGNKLIVRRDVSWK